MVKKIIFTHFFILSNQTFSPKIKSRIIPNSQKFLKNKNLNRIMISLKFLQQKKFLKKKRYHLEVFI